MEIRRSLEANFLTCRICTKAFTDPKVLACMHTFCKPCLDRILEQETLEAARKRRELEQAQQRSSGYSSSSSTSHYKGRWSRAFKNEYSYDKRYPEDAILCPVCSKKTTLPMSGVHGLPDDQLAGKLATIVGKIPDYPVCDVCSSGHAGLYPDSAAADRGSSQQKSKPSRRPWTDIEDGESTSDVLSTEDEEERPQQNGGSASRRPAFGVRRNGRRHNRSGPRKKSQNASDDELFVPSFSMRDQTEPSEAVSACLECAKRLCNVCLQNHTKVAVTANHVIVSLEQLDDMCCPRHPREMKRFFCLTCGELICLVCTFESSISDLNSEGDSEDSSQATGHADHDVLSIRQGLTNLEQCINKSIFDCKQKAERLELLLLGLKSCTSNVNILKNAITSAAEDMIRKINTQKSDLLRELDRDVGVAADQLTAQCDNITSSLASWDELKTDGDCMESVYGMHPVEALTEASLIRDRYYGILEVLTASLPRHDNWSALIKEIDSLEQNFNHQASTEEETATSSEAGTETDSSLTNGVNHIKISKRVRFAPPAEAAGMIPPSYNAHWTRRLGKFIPGEGVDLGRRATPGQLAAEAFAKRDRCVSKSVQASPTDVHGKPLPAERDSRRHRAIQVDLRATNLMETMVQTESHAAQAAIQRIKVDSGTQYQSSDINTPVSFFRSSRQIMVQK